MAGALMIRVAYPGSVYRGAGLGLAESLPSPARLHAAFVSAAAGGPHAAEHAGVLIATDEHQKAVRWLEEHEPLGVTVPQTRVSRYGAVRHRVRAAVDPESGAHHREEDEFEPFSAVDGGVTFAWPATTPDVLQSLRELASEITHVGRADSTVIVHVWEGELDDSADGFRALVPGRGPGEVLRVPEPGRFDVLVDAHRRASKPGGHGPGRRSKQAPDERVEGAGDLATRLRRFSALQPAAPWPFSEVWRIPFQGDLRLPEHRVRAAVAVHRALVSAIGASVPPFITGRDGDGPQSGAGHLAIQFTTTDTSDHMSLCLALPANVPESDRALLLDALDRRPVARTGSRRIHLQPPEQILSADDFWSEPAPILATETPLVLDAPGTPRHGPWSLDDAVLCSVGYALRGPLESEGFAWDTGWTFRQRLVAHLKARGMSARAVRLYGSSSRLVHRAREGDLLVAAEALITLGEFAARERGFLAIGRARHLGGGLLRPLRGLS